MSCFKIDFIAGDGARDTFQAHGIENQERALERWRDISVNFTGRADGKPNPEPTLLSIEEIPQPCEHCRTRPSLDLSKFVKPTLPRDL